MERQGNLPRERWVETATWFLRLGAETWWAQAKKQLSEEEAMDWDTFKHMFQTRFIPPGYIDRKKNEFTELKQGKMSATEYHPRFTNLSRYCPETVANPQEMFFLFKKGTCKKWCSWATTTHCETYQEFYEILLRVEDSENAPDDDDDSDGKNAQMSYDRGQSSLGPRMTQNFKRSGNSLGSSSGGSHSGTARRGGRSTSSSRFLSQGNSSSSGAQLCRRCNTRHFGECKRGERGCYTCGQQGHMACNCP